jgi:hypothetical protein
VFGVVFGVVFIKFTVDFGKEMSDFWLCYGRYIAVMLWTLYCGYVMDVIFPHRNLSLSFENLN